MLVLALGLIYWFMMIGWWMLQGTASNETTSTTTKRSRKKKVNFVDFYGAWFSWVAGIWVQDLLYSVLFQGTVSSGINSSVIFQTFAELKEEENLLLKERIYLKKVCLRVLLHGALLNSSCALYCSQLILQSSSSIHWTGNSIGTCYL